MLISSNILFGGGLAGYSLTHILINLGNLTEQKFLYTYMRLVLLCCMLVWNNNKKNKSKTQENTWKKSWG